MSEEVGCRLSSIITPCVAAAHEPPVEAGWYTKRDAILFVLLLFVVIQVISELVPPFQSPDEVNHIKRAYTLAQGNWLPMREGDSAGGAVDSGLLAYMDSFSALPFDYSAKEDRALLAHTENIRWSYKRVFSDFSNTALYFPIPYVPQAAALNVGERLHLPIGASYSLARTFSLVATLAIILFALLCYPVPMIVIAVFLLPMTLFQMASASMDSVCFAVSLLAASLFMRGSDKALRFGPSLLGVLALCLFVLATVRQNLIFFTLLPAALYPLRRSNLCLALAAFTFLLATGWSLYLTRSFTILGPYDIAPHEVIRFYGTSPLALASISLKTITNISLLTAWTDSFIGNLGGLDTPLAPGVYAAITILLVVLAIATLKWTEVRSIRISSICLVGGGVVATGILVFLMLIAWTPRQAPFIQGVQGRYFVPILTLSAFPLFAGRISPMRRSFCLVIILILLHISLLSTTSALIGRYWLSQSEHSNQMRTS